MKSSVDLSTTYTEGFLLSVIGTWNGAWMRLSFRPRKGTNLEQVLNKVKSLSTMCKEEGTETQRRKNRGAEEKRSHKKQKKARVYLLVSTDKVRKAKVDRTGTSGSPSWNHSYFQFSSSTDTVPVSQSDKASQSRL